MQVLRNIIIHREEQKDRSRSINASNSFSRGYSENSVSQKTG